MTAIIQEQIRLRSFDSPR